MIKKLLHKAGYEIRKLPPAAAIVKNIPDARFYRHMYSPSPVFSPWLGYGEFGQLYELCREHTLVSADRCYVLYALACQALNLAGDFYECGVYKGGTAILLAEMLASKEGGERKLHLFDTFAGMPDTKPGLDLHHAGDFADTSIEAVRARVGRQEKVVFHQGLIPDTFDALEDTRIAFAHVDVDIYQSVLDCCHFIMPRLSPGGFLVFDDYGFPWCPGARKAVDDFFADRPETPLILPTGQAVVAASPISAPLPG